jgi:hypothetical protein
MRHLSGLFRATVNQARVGIKANPNPTKYERTSADLEYAVE